MSLRAKRSNLALSAITVRSPRSVAAAADLAMTAKGSSRKEVLIWRLLDANANRAREGLRVVEDTARFVLENASAARALRGLRHRLDEIMRQHYQNLLSHRDVDRDPGRANVSASHQQGIESLLAANFKRCEEALRVLEEYGRVLSPQTVTDIQKIRFEVYQWEKKLLS